MKTPHAPQANSQANSQANTQANPQAHLQANPQEAAAPCLPPALYQLCARLDLLDFLGQFALFFAREKSVIFEGDRHFYAQIAQELDAYNLPLKAPPPLPSLTTPLTHLQKCGTLDLKEIFAFVSLVRYFLTLKNTLLRATPPTQATHKPHTSHKPISPQEPKSQKEPQSPIPHTTAWLEKIIFPQPLLELEQIFDDEGGFKAGIYPEIDGLKNNIKQTKNAIDEQLRAILNTQKLAPYLVDKSVHFINGHECLLLKAGFAHAIKGVVLERSSGGFFYLLPDSILHLKERQSALTQSLDECLYRICKEISTLLNKQMLFLKFLNKEFDVFDHIHARLCFARAKNLNFAYTLSKNKAIVLRDFCHPALSSPKPQQLDFQKDILMITGVNAGGKTMLLKSALSACVLGKYLIPFSFNPHKSSIPAFKNIIAILSDPQNSKNDISTFAGRMLEFSQILNTSDLLLGIDEIELGTDADEAASLYKVLLEHLLTKNAKVLLTTHHKHLAALMASNKSVQLYAALYDEPAQKPRFEFLDGSIGKSYAFESAARYGIPLTLIERAKATYGEDKERLNELIERSSSLELELLDKRERLDSQIKLYERKIAALESEREAQKAEFQARKITLEKDYKEAKSLLSEALKKDSKSMHQAMNAAHAILHKNEHSKLPNQGVENLAPQNAKAALKVGARVRYQNMRGEIVSLSGDSATIELEGGFRARAKRELLTPINTPKPKPSAPKIKLEKAKSVSVSLDLHGMRGDEAIEKLDEFLSHALVAGYDSVLVYHGIGSGILSKLVREFLLSHPKIEGFEDAPPNMGGYGAKIVRL